MNDSDVEKADALHEQAQRLSDDGRDDEAIERYLQAISLDPQRPQSFYNIGLIYKYAGEWEKSLEYNRKAAELDPEDEASRWNLAIAATALRRWDIARAAWQAQGIQLKGDSGPIDMNFGKTPVRLNPDDASEVVWATRIDPVRARIDNVPYKESGFKHGDIVLHDGAPVGSRMVDGREYAVFNVLELFESSDFSTVMAQVEIEDDTDLEALQTLFLGSPHYFEDWTANIRAICRACSEGTPHEHDDEVLGREWSATRTLGIAVYKGGSFDELMDRWQKTTGARVLGYEQ